MPRPPPQDFNPVRATGVVSAREGNPDLQPQQTDSFEAGYQYKAGGTFYLSTLYYRHNQNGVTDVTTNIGGDAACRPSLLSRTSSTDTTSVRS